MKTLRVVLLTGAAVLLSMLALKAQRGQMATREEIGH
jgi:hypothetical protein